MQNTSDIQSSSLWMANFAHFSKEETEAPKPKHQKCFVETYAHLNDQDGIAVRFEIFSLNFNKWTDHSSKWLILKYQNKRKKNKKIPWNSSELSMELPGSASLEPYRLHPPSWASGRNLCRTGQDEGIGWAMEQNQVNWPPRTGPVTLSPATENGLPWPQCF